MASSTISHADHASTLQTSQVALQVVDSPPSVIGVAVSRLLGQSEDASQWQRYEELLVSCLKTGDAKAAHAILERLISRFGAANERVIGLRGLYQEAVASDKAALEAVLKEYDQILKENRTNIPIQKRRIALLKSLNRPEKAIEWLVELVRLSPTDVEAWAELSDMYLEMGMYSQAVFAMEEVLLTLPNAWNVHARLGEINYMAATAKGVAKADAELALTSAIRRYCRSVELCDGYLRGYYGLGLATEKYLQLFGGDARSSSPSASSVSVADANRLQARALGELKSIVNTTGLAYDEAELDAAHSFLKTRS